MNNWIKTSEKLPKEGQEVLGCLEVGKSLKLGFFALYYEEDGWHWSIVRNNEHYSDDEYIVPYWQPLPALPQKDK